MVRKTSIVFVFLVLFVPLIVQAETATQEGTLLTTQGNDGIIQLRNAAELGDANAMFKLGEIYSYVESVTEDTNEAIIWYTKAANAGHSESMYELGDMYHYGWGVKDDPNKAEEWYSKAISSYRKDAEAGDSNAMQNVAKMYENGEGVPKDYTQALQWYSKAAEAGNRDAMYRIGLIYETGKGVEKDYEQAKDWYKEAIELGDNEAKMRIAIIFLKEYYKIALWGFLSVLVVGGFVYGHEKRELVEDTKKFEIANELRDWTLGVTVRRYVGALSVYLIYWLILWGSITQVVGRALSPDKAMKLVEEGIIESTWEYGWGDHYIWFLITFCFVTFCSGALAGATAKKKGAVVASIANLPVIIFFSLVCWFFYITTIEVESPVAWKIIFSLSILGSFFFSVMGGLLGEQWQKDEFSSSTILGIRPLHWWWLWLVSSFYIRGLATALIPIIRWSWDDTYGPGILHLLLYGYPIYLMYQILSGEILLQKSRLIKILSFIGIYIGGLTVVFLFDLMCFGIFKLVSYIF